MILAGERVKTNVTSRENEGHDRHIFVIKIFLYWHNCYLKSSSTSYNWIIRNKYKIVRNDRREKIFAFFFSSKTTTDIFFVEFSNVVRETFLWDSLRNVAIRIVFDQRASQRRNIPDLAATHCIDLIFSACKENLS